MSYSRGVLIHNFNEDKYGTDLQKSRAIEAPLAFQGSVTHAVHNWKVADSVAKIEPTPPLEKHMLFGHAGDIRDPNTAFKTTEFATAHKYFMQDPAKVKEVGTLTADGFAMSDPTTVEHIPNRFVLNRIQGWGDRNQSHALPPSERFMTENKRSFQKTIGSGEARQPGKARAYGIFSKHVDSIQLTRSVANVRGDHLRSAAQLLVTSP